MPRKKNYECIVKGCSSNLRGLARRGAVRLHTMRRIWLPKVNRMDLDSLSNKDFKKQKLQICNIHFKDRAFTSTFRDSLNRFCEPELFLPNPDDKSSDELVHLHSHIPEYWEFQNLPEDSKVLEDTEPILVDAASLAAETIYSSSSEDEGNNSSGETDGEQTEGVQHILVGDPSKDDLARFAVATLYSEEEEGNESSNDCEIVEIQEAAGSSRLKEALLGLAPPPPVCTRSQSFRTRSQTRGRPAVPSSPAKKKDNKTRERKPPEGCNHGSYIKKLEKCLVDRSIEIQGLKVKNLNLKRKNEELQKATEKHMKLCKLNSTKNVKK